jgi:hypothetical protein
VIEAMSGNHHGTPAHGDRNLCRVSGQSISKPCRACDAAKAAAHENQYPDAPVFAKTKQQGNGSEEGYEEGKETMCALLCRQKVAEDSG